MTIKVYVSGICGSQEVRKQQQRVLFILQSMPIDLQVIDVTEPGREEDRIFMQEECKKHDKKDPLPPQIFNENEYCGDYADFQLANDDDVVLRFLKLESGEQIEKGSAITNGLTNHEEIKADQQIQENHEVPQEDISEAAEVTNAVSDEAGDQQKATSDALQEDQGKKVSSEEEDEEESEEEEESD